MKSKTWVFAIACALAIPLIAHAQKSVNVPFKARLPGVNGNVEVILRAYDQAQGGNLLFEARRSVQVEGQVVFTMVNTSLGDSSVIYYDISSADGKVVSERIPFYVNPVKGNGIGAQPASICFTCGGAWPNFGGAIRTGRGLSTERGGGCDGDLADADDNNPFLCTKTDF